MSEKRRGGRARREDKEYEIEKFQGAEPGGRGVDILVKQVVQRFMHK